MDNESSSAANGLAEDSKDYREVLLKEFKQRQKRNPRYSIRAFARALGISHPPLWRMLYRAQHVSIPTARLIAEHLYPASQEEQDRFVSRVELARANSRAGRAYVKQSHVDRPAAVTSSQTLEALQALILKQLSFLSLSEGAKNELPREVRKLAVEMLKLVRSSGNLAQVEET